MRDDLPGVATEYVDGFGNQRHLTDEAAQALRVAMRLDHEDDRWRRAVRVVLQGDPVDIGASGTVVIEQGGERRVDGPLPTDLPCGYHTFQPDGEGEPWRLIVTPGSCRPLNERVWGWAVQLYAVRSHQSWGIGDFTDLRHLARWSRELGAGMLQINPLGAATPGLPQATSPYYPSSRRFLNPLYLRMEELPRIDCIRELCDAAGAEARRLNDKRVIDRDQVFRLKMRVLEALWEQVHHDDDGRRTFYDEHGEALWRFATFCAISEELGQDWRDWPASYRHPDANDVHEFAERHTDRIEFYRWLQYLLHRQLERAAGELPLVFDLPVGVDPGGVDAWCWQDTLALDARVGAPPDEFNSGGQDWGLPPWIPHRITAARYEPFVETVRASLRYAGGLRIDHVMGLFRLFWIPPGLTADHGTYVNLPAEDLLRILALESARADAWIAGEDLGTVPSGMRDDLDRFRILSHRLVWFEHAKPWEYPEYTVAAITTHDLPTVAGLWSGEDMAAEKRIGRPVREESFHEMRGRFREVCGVDDSASLEEVVVAAYRALGRAPSRVRLASLEDPLLVTERPNMPGTITEWPNWCLALPVPLEEIRDNRLAREIAEIFK